MAKFEKDILGLWEALSLTKLTKYCLVFHSLHALFY